MKSGVTHLLLHPTGMYPSDIPAQACTETTYPFPARIILSSANANAGYYKQYTIASSLFNRKTTNACQMPRPHALSVPADRCGVSLLYIKQLHTPPGVSCCQPLFLHILMHLLTKLEKTSLRPKAFGGDAFRGNTRSHPEHDGKDLNGRWYCTGDGVGE